MSVGPIPWTVQVEWAERHGVRDPSRFTYLIGRMDDTLLAPTKDEAKGGKAGKVGADG